MFSCCPAGGARISSMRAYGGRGGGNGCTKFSAWLKTKAVDGNVEAFIHGNPGGSNIVRSSITVCILRTTHLEK